MLLLAKLEDINGAVTVEEVDDIAIHDDFGAVITTIQAKHSISSSGTTFEDTSYSLWRTMEIWIQKIKSTTFRPETTFVCSTNKKIPESSLLRKILNGSFETAVNEVTVLLNDQETKLLAFQKKDPNSGSSVKQTIKGIKYVLKNKKEFEIIKNGLKIEDEEDIRKQFLLEVHMMSEFRSDVQRDNLYETFYGWLTSTCKARWMNCKVANITKKDFDNKMALISSSPSLINAIFRTKKSLGSVSDNDFEEKRKELFVRQIEDINRNEGAKHRKIKEAIYDFICSDIEISYIVTAGNFTKKDFDDFLYECQIKWQECFDNKVIKETNQYNEEEKNDLAISIFDTIMTHIEIKFKGDFPFNTDNRYIKNGSFLKLSNIPEIGWHPEWEVKYKK